MRDNRDDRTLERSYMQKWRFLIREYERGQGQATSPVPVSAGLLCVPWYQPSDLRQVLQPYYLETLPLQS